MSDDMDMQKPENWVAIMDQPLDRVAMRLIHELADAPHGPAGVLIVMAALTGAKLWATLEVDKRLRS